MHDGDFLDLLKANDHQFRFDASKIDRDLQFTEGTTVIAVHYKDGVMIAGDRRATAGNTVMYDRADKVIEIDESSVMAIAGSPAIAYEIARTLEHSFQYFRRTQLQELSIEGKVRMLARLIRENLPMALQGVGGVIPIFAIYDRQNGHKIFFYDALGANFEVTDFATSGSGSVWIRGVLYHLNRWSGKKLAEMDLETAVANLIQLLETAANFDTATSGVNARSEIFPIIKTVTKDGVSDLLKDQIREIYQRSVDR